MTGNCAKIILSPEAYVNHLQLVIAGIKQCYDTCTFTLYMQFKGLKKAGSLIVKSLKSAKLVSLAHKQKC